MRTRWMVVLVGFTVIALGGVALWRIVASSRRSQLVTTPRNARVSPRASVTFAHGCLGAQLSGHEVPMDGAAGNVWTPIVLVNRSSRPCKLAGYPRVELFDASGQTLHLSMKRSPTYAGAVLPSPISRAPFILQPGGRAWFIIYFEDVQPPCSVVRSLRMTPPGGQGSMIVLVKPVHQWDVCEGGFSITAATTSKPPT
jgi:uncharacterized protein DUF4232